MTIALASGGYANDLVINNGASFDLNDNTVVIGTMENNGLLTTSNGTLHVSGDWINNGTFAYGTSLVTMEGTFQKYHGNTTFYNFSKVSNGPDTFEVTAGHAINIVSGGKIHVEGLPGNKLNWVSDASNGWWYLNSAGTEEVRYVSVASSDASGGHTIYSFNSQPIAGPMNTINWYWSYPLLAFKVYLEGFYQGAGVQRVTDVSIHLCQGPNPDLSYAVASKEVTLSASGTAELDFSGTSATQGDYYVAVFHNVLTAEGSNHLAIITANLKYLDSSHYTLVDFTSTGEVYGTEPMVQELDGAWSMRGGDADGDGVVTANDLTLVLNNFAQEGSTEVIKMGDFDGDAAITGNDLNILLNSWTRQRQFNMN